MDETSSTFEKNAHSLTSWWEDLQLACVFLTRIPWELKGDVHSQALNRALRVFPVMGLLIGGVGATALGLSVLANLPIFACSLISIIICVLITGALHEDGLADVADGFGGGYTIERKLDIMRDSRVGSYGVLAMIFAIGLKASALSGFENWWQAASALIAAACLSRVAPALLIYFLNPARTDGLAATMEKPQKVIVAQSAGLGIALFLLCSPLGAGLAALFVSFTILVGFGLLARKQVGGHTGDICGAAQQLMEISALLTLVALS